FSLGPLPAGDYLVTGVLDQNQNQLQDSREAYGTTRTQRGRPDAGEVWAFVHDTTPPRIQTVTVDDSVSATVTFAQKLDPRQRLTPQDARLRLLPDSTPVAVASILPKAEDDSLYKRAPARRDTAPAAADTLEQPDSVPPQGAAPGRRRAPAPEMLTSRPPLFDRLVVRVPKPWSPGARLVLELRGVRNVTGVAGSAVGVIAVPEKAKPTGAPARPPARRDSAAARPPARQPAAPPRR
ncbi:MAG TPA: hypothetical protein VFZ87_01885, partial [Gemmatimonadales bacterium]